MKKHDIVQVKSNPELRGVIVEAERFGESFQYSVFINGSIQKFYAEQLTLFEEVKTEASLKLLKARITAEVLHAPGTFLVGSPNSGDVDFVPYQYRPVLKFLKASSPRLLIADDVGVGKTIETCLIFKELQARQTMENVFVICPKPLVIDRKWSLEFKRFQEDFVELDGKTLQYCVSQTDMEGEWPRRYSKAIIPYSLLSETLWKGTNRKTGLDTIKNILKIDLLIVDESHKIKNSQTHAHYACHCRSKSLKLQSRFCLGTPEFLNLPISFSKLFIGFGL